jgi:hypothetical protein
MTQERSIFTKYLEQLREKLIKKYDELGLRASGKYEEKLEGEASDHGFVLFGAKHSEYMERGRGPGGDYKKLAPIIKEWIEVKSTLPQFFRDNKQSLSFAIAHRIANEGIKVPNQFNKGQVVSSVVNDFLANDVDKIINELGLVYLERFRSEISNVFQEVA